MGLQHLLELGATLNWNRLQPSTGIHCNFKLELLPILCRNMQQGYVAGYDKYTLLFKANNADKESMQLIYKHAISTVSSSHNTYAYSQTRASNASNQTVKAPAEQKG
jgi:hypothetical protein